MIISTFNKINFDYRQSRIRITIRLKINGLLCVIPDTHKIMMNKY
jgi:hypothetical protein